MHNRSYSPLQVMRKINTQRSTHVLHTTRNSESKVLDDGMNGNTSQTLIKGQGKFNHRKQGNQKKLLSYFYFKDCSKNSKNLDSQNFSKFLKNKNSTNKRKRCITAVNLTTNKVSTQIPDSIFQKLVTEIQAQQEQVKTKMKECFCKNHPSKIGHFQQQNSLNCFCHQCSIEVVKNNKRLIYLSPEIVQVKSLIYRKIRQAQDYGSQLCRKILQKIHQGKRALQHQYHQIKMKLNLDISSGSGEAFIPLNFIIKQVNWNFIQDLSLHGIYSFKQLPSLDHHDKQYKLNKQHVIKQKRQNFPNKQSHTSKQLILNKKQIQKIDKSQGNLIEEIKKALNYASKSSKQNVRKTLNLKDKEFNFQLQNLHKENISPNIVCQKNVDHGNQFDEVARISFGLIK